MEGINPSIQFWSQQASELNAGDADIKQNKLVMVLENYMSWPCDKIYSFVSFDTFAMFNPPEKIINKPIGQLIR